jgi:hypothetical protein
MPAIGAAQKPAFIKPNSTEISRIDLVIEVIWGAEVEFVDVGAGQGPEGNRAVYDVVEILESGALRVARIWRGSNQVGWYEVETCAAYFPAGSWKRVTPLQGAGPVVSTPGDW